MYSIREYMELTDLKVFAAIVEQGTATKAAKTLGMTQPGVSKHLSRLESDLKDALFKREGKYLVLNAFGEFLYERVRKVLAAVEDLSQSTSSALMPAGSLDLGLIDAAMQVITPASLVEFRRRYPRIHLSLDVDSSNLIEEGVLGGRYDLGIITAAAKPNALLHQETLFTDCIDAVVGHGHALAKRKRVTLGDVVEHPLIISPRRRRTRSILEEAFKAHGLKAHDTIDTYLHTTAVRLAEAGLGVALLPRAFITREVPPTRCAHLPIAGNPIKRTLCMIRRKDAEPTEATTYFSSVILGLAKGLGGRPARSALSPA